MSHDDVIYILGMRFFKDGERLRRLNVVGRPSWATAYGEATQLVRVPVSLLPELTSKMEQMREREERLRAAIEADILYTTPGYTFDDLERVESC